MAVVAVVVQVDIVRVEVQVVRVVRVARVERTRPIVAVGTNVVGRSVVAVACSRQKDLKAFGSHLILMRSGTSMHFFHGMSRKSFYIFLNGQHSTKTGCL